MCVTHRTKKDGWRLPFSVIYPDGMIKSGSIQTSPDQVSLCGLTVTHHHDVVFTFMDVGFPPDCTSLRCHRPGGVPRWHHDTSIGNGSGGLVTPHYITIDPLNRIIVSDHHGSKVSIYDSSGSHLLSFPRVTLADDDEDDLAQVTPKPSGICVDSKGNIYVAFPTYEVISLFTANGQFIRHVVVTSGKARGISICDDRYLAVGTFDCGLFLYDLKPSLVDEEEPESRDPQTIAEVTRTKDKIKTRDQCATEYSDVVIITDDMEPAYAEPDETVVEFGPPGDEDIHTEPYSPSLTDEETQTTTYSNIQRNGEVNTQTHSDFVMQVNAVTHDIDAVIQENTDAVADVNTDAVTQVNVVTLELENTDAATQDNTVDYTLTDTCCAAICSDIARHTHADMSIYTVSTSGDTQANEQPTRQVCTTINTYENQEIFEGNSEAQRKEVVDTMTENGELILNMNVNQFVHTQANISSAVTDDQTTIQVNSHANGEVNSKIGLIKDTEINMQINTVEVNDDDNKESTTIMKDSPSALQVCDETLTLNNQCDTFTDEYLDDCHQHETTRRRSFHQDGEAIGNPGCTFYPDGATGDISWDDPENCLPASTDTQEGDTSTYLSATDSTHHFTAENNILFQSGTLVICNPNKLDSIQL
jgi:hypothetical protein